MTSPDAEAKKKSTLTPRFWFSLLLTVPLFADVQPVWAWLVCSIIIGIGGRDFLMLALKKSPNRFTLVSIAIAVLYLYSLLAMLFSSVLYFDQVGAIICIVLLGELLNEQMKSTSLEPFVAYANLLPTKAQKLFMRGRSQEVNSNDLVKDDVIRIEEGKKVPVDGVIIEGDGLFDESIYSGSKEPVKRAFGEQVFASTTILKGGCLVRVLKVTQSTLFSNVVQIVQEVLDSKETKKSMLVPVALVIGAVAFLLWAIIGGLMTGVLRFATVLVAASLTAYRQTQKAPATQAIIASAKNGIVVRKREVFSHLPEIDTMAVESGQPQDLPVVQVLKSHNIKLIQHKMTESEIAELHKQGRKIAYITGPETNPPLMSQIEVPIAILEKQDIAKITLPVILLRHNFVQAVRLIDAAVETAKVARQNGLFVGAYHLVVFALILFGTMGPISAALCMIFAPFVVATNSLRLQQKLYQDKKI